jgi:hypothetical protein
LKAANINSEEGAMIAQNIESFLNNSNIDRLKDNGVNVEQIEGFKKNFLEILRTIEKV